MSRLIFFLAFALTVTQTAIAQANTSFDPSGFWRGALWGGRAGLGVQWNVHFGGGVAVITKLN